MKKLFLIGLFYLISTKIFAQLSLGKIFTDNMVLQREKPICIFGKAIPTENITISFSNITQSLVVKPDSTWETFFKPQKANKNGQKLIVQNGKTTITLNNILIGDVWICAGQSNMEFPLKNEKYAEESIKSAFNPILRLYNYKKALPTSNKPFSPENIKYLNPQNFYDGSWLISDSNAVQDFSAIAYYFGKELTAKTEIPIGLISLAVGGSPLEAWLDKKAVESDNELMKIFQGDWMKNKNLEEWCILRASQNLDGLIQIPKDENGYNHPFKPEFLYKSTYEYFSKVAIKGVIWYQGESNSLSKWRAEQHEKLFPFFIDSWRKQWGQNLPFYFCQLSSISTEKGYKSENWGYFRDSQHRMSASISNIGMAVTSDVGHLTDVHPTNKKVVGERLAKLALNKTYQFKTPCQGPKPIKLIQKNGKIQVVFDSKLYLSEGKIVKGFSFEKEDGTIHRVDAILRKKQVDIYSNLKPKRVFYGYQPFSEGNLKNINGLPCSTFSF